MTGEKRLKILFRAIALAVGIVFLPCQNGGMAFADDGEENKSFLQADIEWAIYDLIDIGYKHVKLPIIPR